MRKKAKFNKKKCLTCAYHGVGMGYPVKIDKTGHGDTTLPIFCDYAGKNGNGATCLQPGPRGTTIDIRGCDHKNCALYKKGRMKAKSVGFDNDYIFIND